MISALRQTFSRSARFATLAAVAAAVGLLVVGLSMAMFNENLSRSEKLRDVTVQADILSGSVTAALAFDDSKLAQEYVDALGANRDVEAAGVYDLNGKLVAGYARPGSSAPAVNRVGPPSLANDHIVVSRPIAQSGTALGSVYLRTVSEPFARRAMRYAGIGLLIVMAALLVAVLGASNASLAVAHRKLKVEMEERARTEEALRVSRELEAAAKMEAAAERSRTALRQSEQQLEFALDAGRLGSWTVDVASGRLTASEYFLANYGLAPDAQVRTISDLDQYIHPEDRDRQRRARRNAIRGGADFEAEYRTISPEGDVRWILIRGHAGKDNDGRVRRMAGVSLDITGRKEAEERQRLLLDELNHRVKNTLATVQSIAVQTRRDTLDAAAFERAFLARLAALSRVHDLLSHVSWVGASLADVVRQTLAPHLLSGERSSRLVLEGPDLALGPNAAVTLAMAFHELATNAAKYGAYSVETGRVEVRWQADDPKSPSLIEINWRELGGPRVEPPTRRGFGTRFVERGLAREFDGEVQLEFAPGGVRCQMRIPLSAKLRMAA